MAVSNTRRVVTGHNSNGRSVVISDGRPPFVHTRDGQVGWSSTDVFRTGESPAEILANTSETTLGPRRQLPTSSGTVIRVNVFPPESEDVRSMTLDDAKRAFESLGNVAAATFGKGGRHPLMHRTETVDYAIVLSGEITMLLDEGDVVLRQGDILVQCGTNHAWVNKTQAPATVCFVLLDGKFEPDLQKILSTMEGT